MNHRSTYLPWLAPAAAALLLVACGDASPTGTLTLSLEPADLPVDPDRFEDLVPTIDPIVFERVRVVADLGEVTVHDVDNGWETVTDDWGRFELSAAGSGLEDGLVEADLRVGTYNQIRLVVNGAWVVFDGVPWELTVPSGSETGTKIHTRFCVQPGANVELTLHWNVWDSIHGDTVRGFRLVPSIASHTGASCAPWAIR